MKSTEIFALFMIIAIVSFLGFIVENVWLAFTKGYMDNRNMNLPFLIGYGIAIILIYFLFGTPTAPVILGKKITIKSVTLKVLIYLALCALCVSIGEILLGTFVEKTCGIYWWDYSRLPLHITKYTSIPTSLAFGALITLFMAEFFTPLFNYFVHMNYRKLKHRAITIMALMTTDFVHNAKKLYRHKEMVPIWKIDTARFYKSIEL